MNNDFEELDFQQTPLGDISLRRRIEPRLNGKVLYEVKLDDEFLMSSLFTEAEIQLANLALAGFEQESLDVVVGGLGLGYTALAALANPAVRSLVVIEVMQPVIDWHLNRLVPLGGQLVSNPRCKIVRGDFFELAATGKLGFGGTENAERVHAVLLDIDHSPAHWLNPGNSTFYSAEGLARLAASLLPSGVFGLWSNDAPDPAFTERLNSVFVSSEAHVVAFANPYTGSESANTVYIGRKAAG